MTAGFNEHMGHVLPYAANCTFLFTEVDLLERPAAARAAGFDAIEFWWPWPDQPVPPDTEIDKFVTAIRDAGVHLIGLNFFAGDLAGADCGVLSIPARSAEFRDNIAVTMGIGEALGVPAFNALYGNRVSDVTPKQQDDLATENLTLAARAAAAIGGTVLVEPVSGPKPYPLRTANDVAAVLDRVHAPNLGMCCDLFHLANNGDDIDAALAASAESDPTVSTTAFLASASWGNQCLPVGSYAVMLPGTERRTPPLWSQISDQCGQFMHRLPKSDLKLRIGRNLHD